MGLGDFFKSFFAVPTINVADNGINGENLIRTSAVTTFATFSVIEIIASICSKAEFKTYANDVEYKGNEWYSLNVKPNVNQSSTEFWKEAICNLLYSGELLIIPYGNQKIIADGFTMQEYALRENTFHGVYRNGFTFPQIFKASEVFYIKYANEDMTMLLNGIFATYSKLFDEAANNYVLHGGQKGILEISAQATGHPKYDEIYKDIMNNKFKSFYKAKNAVMPLLNGMKYVPTTTGKSANEITDLKNLFDEALARAAQAYKFPPQLVRGEVSGIGDAVDYMLTICIDPLLNCVSEEFTGKEFTVAECIAGNYIDADTSSIKHIDILSLGANIDKLIASSFSSVNDVKDLTGQKRIPEKWADEHVRTKNYDTVENLNNSEGGENK